MAEIEYFLVHSASKQSFQVEGHSTTGRPMMGVVDGLVVELVPENNHHGTVTRRYIPDNEDELSSLIEKYTVGARIVVTTELTQEQPSPAEAPAPTSITVRAEDTQSFVPESAHLTTATGARQLTGEADARVAAHFRAKYRSQ